MYPISDQLTFIAPNLRSALCKQIGSIVLVDWTKHRLDCQPEIGIFPVTRLDIEADLRSASFIIEADLKLADLTVTVAVTVTRGFETALDLSVRVC